MPRNYEKPPKQCISAQVPMDLNAALDRFVDDTGIAKGVFIESLVAAYLTSTGHYDPESRHCRPVFVWLTPSGEPYKAKGSQVSVAVTDCGHGRTIELHLGELYRYKDYAVFKEDGREVARITYLGDRGPKAMWLATGRAIRLWPDLLTDGKDEPAPVVEFNWKRQLDRVIGGQG